MKGLVQFIQEAVNTTAIVNKIKKAFEKEFGKKVTLGSARANFQQLYDVYVYSMDLDVLKKVRDIIKKYLTVWKGYTDDELKDLIKKKQEFLDASEKGYERTLKDFPIEFLRFTSSDLRKMLKEDLLTEGINGKLETSFEDLCKHTKTDPSKEVWILTRNVKDNFMKLKHFKNGEEASEYIDTLRDGKSEDGYYQGMSNDEEELKKLMKFNAFRKYKKIFEGCGGKKAEHKIVQDAAGNWRIKGTPGKGTNTDKEGLWAAKYKTEEDAKKALAAYHIHKHEWLEFCTDDMIEEAVKADNGEPWEVYINGSLDKDFTEGAKKWKKQPKVGNGCYAGGTVFKVVKIDGNKVYMEEDDTVQP